MYQGSNLPRRNSPFSSPRICKEQESKEAWHTFAKVSSERESHEELAKTVDSCSSSKRIDSWRVIACRRYYV